MVKQVYKFFDLEPSNRYIINLKENSKFNDIELKYCDIYDNHMYYFTFVDDRIDSPMFEAVLDREENTLSIVFFKLPHKDNMFEVYFTKSDPISGEVVDDFIIERDEKIIEEKQEVTEVVEEKQEEKVDNLVDSDTMVVTSGEDEKEIEKHNLYDIMETVDSDKTEKNRQKLLKKKLEEKIEQKVEKKKVDKSKGKKEKDIRLSAIVISFKKPNRLNTCINSLFKTLSIVDELIIVDNGSGDDVMKVLKDFEHQTRKSKDRVKIIRNGSNLLFSKAVNTGIQNSRGKYIAIINNDTKVKNKNMFNVLTSYLDKHKNVGTISPVNVKSNGRVYCSGASGSGSHRRDKPDKPRQTEWNNMGCLITRREYFYDDKIGFLPEGKCEMCGDKHRWKNKKLDMRHYHSDEWFSRKLTDVYGLKHMVHNIQFWHFHGEKDG